MTESESVSDWRPLTIAGLSVGANPEPSYHTTLIAFRVACASPVTLKTSKSNFHRPPSLRRLPASKLTGPRAPPNTVGPSRPHQSQEYAQVVVQGRFPNS